MRNIFQFFFFFVHFYFLPDQLVPGINLPRGSPDNPWSQLAIELLIICTEWRTSAPHKWERSHRAVFMVRHPGGSYKVPPLLFLKVATPENKVTR